MSSLKKRKECYITAEMEFSDKTVKNKEKNLKKRSKNVVFVIGTNLTGYKSKIEKNKDYDIKICRKI